MGQCYFALLFCRAMLLILMDQGSEYALDIQTDGKLTHVLGIICSPFCVGQKRGEKHL